MKTMSAPRTVSARSSRLSSAAFSPMAGSPPTPRPRVSLSPMRIFVSALDRARAWASVFTATNSTPKMCSSIMRSTALQPPPPTPITLIGGRMSRSEWGRDRMMGRGLLSSAWGALRVRLRMDNGRSCRARRPPRRRARNLLGHERLEGGLELAHPAVERLRLAARRPLPAVVVLAAGAEAALPRRPAYQTDARRVCGVDDQICLAAHLARVGYPNGHMEHVRRQPLHALEVGGATGEHQARRREVG